MLLCIRQHLSSGHVAGWFIRARVENSICFRGLLKNNRSVAAECDSSLVDVMLHPSAYQLLEKRTSDWHQQAEAEQVGAEAGSEKEDPTGQNHGTVKEFFGRHSALVQLRLDAVGQVESLGSGQISSSHAREDNQYYGRSGPDQGSHFKQDNQFGYGDDNEQN
jgi:hypothetical protein